MNIIVAGAGTAGWLAALYTNKKYPDASVTVVHDDKTPIIGVGEGTTPGFIRFMNFIDITTEELVQNCEATIKNGIKFTNWVGDGTHYYHSFFSHGYQDDLFLTSIFNGINIEKCEIASLLSESNKILLNQDEKCFVDSDNKHAVHFNAGKLAEYLKDVGVKRGIKIVTGKISNVYRDNNDYVTEIELDTKQIIKTDFVFDCTGFARIFVSKVYNSPLKTYEKNLPTKRAMPFFIDKDGETPPFTEAIAMKYGWLWKIPVGNRFGCGYVFDSDFITDEEAYEEICEITKQKPIVNRKISFKPEYHTKPFNKNTLALGLSHGFFEPLEATSLMLVTRMLSLLPDIRKYKQTRVDVYNDRILKDVETIADMLYIHYLTPRKDTDFWKNFEKNNIMPKHTFETLKKLKNISFYYPNLVSDLDPFSTYSFMKCMEGVNAIDVEFIDDNKDLLRDDIETIFQILKENEHIYKKSKKHDDYLNYWTNI